MSTVAELQKLLDDQFDLIINAQNKISELKVQLKTELKKIPKLVECTACDSLVMRYYSKDRPRTEKDYKIGRTRPVFVDSSGRQFNGNQCPDCKYGRMSA